MRLRRRAAVILLVAAGLQLQPHPADACSWTPSVPRGVLPRSDGAFIGTLLFVEGQPGPVYSSAALVTYRFGVEWVVKGDIGRTIDVESRAQTASCGLGDFVRVGERVGLVLERQDGDWHAWIGSIVDPGELLSAAEPLPVADGKGPAALIVSGTYGIATSIALDARGRTLGYGGIGGPPLGYLSGTGELAPCPGYQRVADFSPADRRLSIKDLVTLKNAPVYLPGFHVVRHPENLVVSCRSQDGEHVLIFAKERHGDSRILRPEPPRKKGVEGIVHTLYKGDAVAGVFHPTRGVAYLATGRRGSEIIEFEVTSGSSRHIATIPASVQALALSPTGRYLAVTGSSSAKTVVGRIDVDRRELRTTTLPVLERGRLLWADEATLIHTGSEDGHVRTFSSALKEIGRIAPGGWPTVVRDGVLFGMSSERLLSAAVPNGRVTEVNRFDRATIHGLLGVPPGAMRELNWGEANLPRERPRYLGPVDPGLFTAPSKRSWIPFAAVVTAILAFALLLRFRRRRVSFTG